MKQIKHSFISILTLIISFFVTMHLFAQNGNTSNCNCSQALDEIIHKVETEYPGFSDKTKDTFNYSYYKKQIAEAAVNKSSGDCILLLKKYIEYFKDRHLHVVDNFTNLNSNEKPEIVEWEIEKFKEYCKKSKDSLEGIWSMDNFTIGIYKKDSTYIGFVLSTKNLNWKPGEIKLKIHKNSLSEFFWGDHSKEETEININKIGVIYIKEPKVVLVKQFPAPQIIPKELQSLTDEMEGFYIKKISDKTLFIKLQSFAGESSKKVKKMVDENKPLLNSFENWIIDVRGNGGGYEEGYAAITPYLYTNPVRYLDAENFITQTLIENFTAYSKNLDSVKQSNDVRYWKETLSYWNKNIGKFVFQNYKRDTPVGYIKKDKVLPYPKNVVILINKRVASAAEIFVDEARQSKKVKLMGQPTAGLFDYTRVLRFKLNCSKYSLIMPTLRLSQVKYFQTDGIGIRPDIFLDEYVADWVEYARQYLEN